MTCFLAKFSEKPCDGLLVRVHLIPRQLIKREFPHGVRYDMDWREHEGRKWVRVYRGEDVSGVVSKTTEQLLVEPQTWVWACGGITGGPGGHHGMLDSARTIRLGVEDLPEQTVRWAREHGLLWFLEREYGAGVDWEAWAAAHGEACRRVPERPVVDTGPRRAAEQFEGSHRERARAERELYPEAEFDPADRL